MSQHSPLCIGMALAFSWLSKNAWRRDDSRVEDIYYSDLYIELAKRAEAAKLDFLFRPDTLFLNQHAIEHEPGFSSLDPMVLLASLASHTQHIGLVATASTALLPPYAVARQLQSLQWISQGRAGWNIVTALEGQGNFGQEAMLPSQQRYQKAAEFTQVVKKLWRSYPQSAVIADAHSGQYADPKQIKAIDHQGEYFSVQGPLNIPASPYGDVALFQAGASEFGRDFAAKTAHAIFAASPDIESGIELRQDLQRRAKQQGRDPQEIKVLPGLSLFLAPTKEQAEQLHRDTHSNLGLERRFEYLKQALGVDFSSYPLDRTIGPDQLPQGSTPVRSLTHAQLLRRLIERERPSLEALLNSPEVIGSAHWLVIGTPEDAVAAIVKRAEANSMDGFIAVPSGSWQSVTLFLEQVMPRLAELGLAHREYRGRTLSDNLGIKA